MCVTAGRYARTHAAMLYYSRVLSTGTEQRTVTGEAQQNEMTSLENSQRNPVLVLRKSFDFSLNIIN